MTLTNAAGSPLSETALNALTSAVPAPPALRTVNEDILQKFTYDGGKFEKGTRLLFHAGQVVPQAAIDALFLDATVVSISPATGPAAGGTDVTITGTNLGGVLGVTVGGAAATMVRVISETKLTCKVPAHATGAVNVVVTDDSGVVTLTNGYTYS